MLKMHSWVYGNTSCGSDIVFEKCIEWFIDVPPRTLCKAEIIPSCHVTL